MLATARNTFRLPCSFGHCMFSSEVVEFIDKTSAIIIVAPDRCQIWSLLPRCQARFVNIMTWGVVRDGVTNRNRFPRWCDRRNKVLLCSYGHIITTEPMSGSLGSRLSPSTHRSRSAGGFGELPHADGDLRDAPSPHHHRPHGVGVDHGHGDCWNHRTWLADLQW